MSDFIRPELRAFMWRWRDVLMGAVLALLGLWWGLGGVGISRWLGYTTIALGIIWAVAGVQRARFRQGGDGPGVVQIRERRLAYFGPLDGGVIDVDDMTMLELDPEGYPSPHWVLSGVGGQRIAIPVNATGAEDLFDIFAGLPGIKTTVMLDLLSRSPDKRVIVWTKVRPLLH
ncbi:hypothetical protein ACJ5NV_02390 [Loktanella agnita]|uniref:hypothetical protein n=1 Tax=Loktanella agnita TaxID=287097 RepID=UPI0039865179